MLLRTDRFSTLGKDGPCDSEQGWSGLTCRVNTSDIVIIVDWRCNKGLGRRGGAGGKKVKICSSYSSACLFVEFMLRIVEQGFCVWNTSAPAKLLICRVTSDEAKTGGCVTRWRKPQSDAGRQLRDGGDYGYPTRRVIITRLPSLLE